MRLSKLGYYRGQLQGLVMLGYVLYCTVNARLLKKINARTVDARLCKFMLRCSRPGYAKDMPGLLMPGYVGGMPGMLTFYYLNQIV